MSVELSAARWDDVALGEVVATAALGGAFALLYAYDRCALARVSGGVLQEVAGESDLAGVYEARVFADPGEIRWIRRGVEGLGTAVWLGEAPPPGRFGEMIAAPPVTGSLESRYLLWGSSNGREPANGWCEVATAQIGFLVVPLPPPRADRTAVLLGREYLGEDEHGNTHVVEERLVGLDWDGDADESGER